MTPAHTSSVYGLCDCCSWCPARAHPHAGFRRAARRHGRRAGAAAAAPAARLRPIRCWPARCSGCVSRDRSGWPPASIRTAWGCSPGVRWVSGTPRSAPSPRSRSPATRRRACSGCPPTAALLNRMGFNNHGAGALAIQLARHRPEVPIGVNIGKTKTTPAADAADDYRASARLVGPLASYLVVNVSSPNTPGLRDLQAVESLRPILSAVLGRDLDAGAGEDRAGHRRFRRRRHRGPGRRTGPGRHRRHQHHGVARRA